jgi:PhnB protein
MPAPDPKTSIAPMLSVRNGAKAVEFYQAAFAVRMVMIVADPDAAFNRAVAAGAIVVRPVENRYGWRLGRLVDPYGHHWEIGKPLA